MHMWSDAFDDMNKIDAMEGLSVDQRLKVAEIKALLSISQELSNIHHSGINAEYSPD